MQGSVYELLLRGGHVIDPANGVDARMDVAIAEGKIAAVAPEIGEPAKKVVAVEGLYVVPGLIDLHMHAFGYKGWLFPDVHMLPNGVTTAVDAGGAGWKSFERFRQEIILTSKTRVLAFLNIVGAGMLDIEEQDISEMEPGPAVEMVRRFPDLIVGIKTAHYRGPGWEAMERTMEAGVASGKPVMVDFRPNPQRSYEDLLLRYLRPGDIHTHMYAQHIPLLDDDGRVNSYVWEARKRGVLFDLGHGAGSFWFRIAVPALAQGFAPDTVSTDLHRSSALRPNAQLMATMSKLLCMGMSLYDAIAKATVRPAAILGRPDLGTLSVGAEADVAVLKMEEGDFGFVDSGLARLRGTRRLTCKLTVRRGEVLWDPEGLTCPDWRSAGKYIFLDGPLAGLPASAIK